MVNCKREYKFDFEFVQYILIRHTGGWYSSFKLHLKRGMFCLFIYFSVVKSIDLFQIVFLTTLFYLLSSSGDFYKPIELMTKFSSSSSRFGLALEGAVNGVFKASFKMAVFYGMWTWFIHNLFGVKIVYLPSGRFSLVWKWCRSL